MIKYATSPKKHRAWGANTAARWHVWRVWQAPIGLLALVLVVLVGCGEHCSCPPNPVHILHMPGVRTVSPTTAILDTPRDDAGRLEGITPFEGDDGDQYALLSIDQSVYLLDVTRSRVALIPDVLCVGTIAISPDHHHIACPTNVNPYAYCCDGLLLAALSSTWPPRVLASNVITDGGGAYNGPTWGPDGRHIVVLRGIARSCQIEVDRVDPSDTYLAVTGFMLLATESTCDVHQVAWAPDGRSLALVTDTAVESLPTDRLPPDTFSTMRPTVPDVVTPTLLVTGFSSLEWIAWARDSRSLALLDANSPEPLHTVNLADGQISILFTLPAGSDEAVFPFAWTADMHSLLFAFGPRQRPPIFYGRVDSSLTAHLKIPQICMCPQAPTILYAYTPPIAEPPTS